MQNNAWATFLRHLPPALQEGLSVKTLGGTEISIQMLLRIDHEFFACKGRLSGTQDTGRVFFVPFNQIDHLYYQKEIREEDFNAAFDSLLMPAVDAGPVPTVAAAVHAPVEVREPEAIVPEPPPVNRPTPVPIKSAVLERFRSRSGTSCPGTSSSRAS